MRFLTRLMLLMTFISVQLQAQDILPAAQVFQPQLQWQGQQLKLSIDFPEHYYLYADKTRINGQQDYEALPPAEEHQDEYLGATRIWASPPQLIFSAGSASTVVLETQGCRKNVICYPPQRWELDVPPRPSLFQRAPQPLPLESAFALQMLQQENGDVLLSAAMPEGYYLYRDRIKIETESALNLNLPAGEAHEDDYFGRTEIYREHLEIRVPVQLLGQSKTLHWTVQGCAEGLLCYPPRTLSLDLMLQALPQANLPSEALPEALSPAQERDWAQTLQHQPWWALLLVFAAGIGVSLTACVYPLLPIVSGIIIGDTVSPRRALALVSVYVFAMALALAALGAVFALFNINLQLLAQKPIFSALAALILLALSLSLFDVYTLQLPRALQNRVEGLNQKQASGSYWGAAMMGVLSILVVSPCATPVLSALLLFSPQNLGQSALTLFVFGLGTGMPLLLFSTVLKRLMPRAGSWMTWIKRFFALVVLGLAVWLLGRSQSAWADVFWAIYAVFVGVYLLPQRWQSKNDRVALFFSLLAFLSALWFTQQALPSHEKAPASASVSLFQKVQHLEEIENIARNSHKPIILDFYADWCLSCQHWEREIWSAPEFAANWANFHLLKVDMTDFSAEHQALLQRFDLVGAPAVLLLQPEEALPVRDRIIGEISKAQFAQKLAQWQSS